MGHELSEYTGVVSDFRYTLIPNHVERNELERYCSKLRQAYANDHTKKWSEEKYTEWLTRHYLAVKMMMSATILLTSHRFAERKNLKIVQPYLLYYGCVCSCKALIYTLPDKDWQRDGLAKISHQKVIKFSVDALAKLSRRFARTSNETLQRLKAYRELFSYRFPASDLKR